MGISGGKDSTALAIYLRDQYPDLDLEYYFCDTGKELAETYQLLDGLEDYLYISTAGFNCSAEKPLRIGKETQPT